MAKKQKKQKKQLIGFHCLYEWNDGTYSCGTRIYDTYVWAERQGERYARINRRGLKAHTVRKVKV